MNTLTIANEKAQRPIPAAALLILIPALFGSFAIFTGFCFDLFHLGIQPWLTLGLSLGATFALAVLVKRSNIGHFHFDALEFLGVAVLVVGISVYLIYPSLPTLLPPSRHFDAVNHFLLASAIFESGQLPHDFSDQVIPYFFSTYPVGGALLDSLVSIWIGSTPLRTLHPLGAVVVGLSAALVFVLLTRLLPNDRLYKIIAFVSALFLFTAWDFFVGAVNERYFFAQVFAQFYALITFWWLYEYTLKPTLLAVMLMTLALATVIMSHPSPIAAPLIVVTCSVGLMPVQPVGTRLRNLLILAVGLAIVGIFFVLPRFHGWINQTSYGEAAPIAWETMGVLLPTLAGVGVVLAILPRWRKTFWLALAMAAGIAAQFLSLLLWQIFLGRKVDIYYFEKALYLLIYPLAMFAALPFAEIAQRLRIHLTRNTALGLFGGVVLVSTILVWRFYPPRPFSPLTESELQVALWAKQHLDVRDIGFISRIHEDAYWIQLGIFQQSPYAPATTSWYHLGPMTYGEWRANSGWPQYAIVRNLANVPHEAVVSIIHQVGASAVIRKPVVATAPFILQPTRPVNARFGQILNLIGYDFPEQISAHAPFTVTLYWKPIFWATQRLELEAQLVDANGEIAQRVTSELFQSKYPTQRWPIDTVQRDFLTLNPDGTLAPGKYRLQLEVFHTLNAKRLPVTIGLQATERDSFTFEKPLRVK